MHIAILYWMAVLYFLFGSLTCHFIVAKFSKIYLRISRISPSSRRSISPATGATTGGIGAATGV
jgi:hypothetical protein